MADKAEARRGLQLPAPTHDANDPILAAFERRKTFRDISPTPLSSQQLSDLLWSGGSASIARSVRSGRRAAPLVQPATPRRSISMSHLPTAPISMT